MSKFKSIADMFGTYAEQVVPADASDAQMKETKRAFYGGAFALLIEMCAFTTEVEGDAHMETMFEEAEKFAEGVEKGEN